MKKNRCYYCGNANLADALFDHVCLWHFLKLSFQLAVMQARKGRLTSRLFWELFLRDLLSRLGLLLMWWSPELRADMQHMRRLIWQKLHCPWCWQKLRLCRWMPCAWTSCLCPHHYQIEKQRLAIRRVTRLASCVTAESVHEPMEVVR